MHNVVHTTFVMNFSHVPPNFLRYCHHLLEDRGESGEILRRKFLARPDAPERIICRCGKYDGNKTPQTRSQESQVILVTTLPSCPSILSHPSRDSRNQTTLKCLTLILLASKNFVSCGGIELCSYGDIEAVGLKKL